MASKYKLLNESVEWTPAQIKKIERGYNAKYLLETCVRDMKGNWINYPMALFWTPNVHPNGSNYFIFFRNEQGRATIADGLSAASEPIYGLAIDGEVIYSRYRHDYRSHNGVYIDGGRDYLRSGGERFKESCLVRIRIKDDEVIIRRVRRPGYSSPSRSSSSMLKRRSSRFEKASRPATTTA